MRGIGTSGRVIVHTLMAVLMSPVIVDAVVTSTKAGLRDAILAGPRSQQVREAEAEVLCAHMPALVSGVKPSAPMCPSARNPDRSTCSIRCCGRRAGLAAGRAHRRRGVPLPLQWGSTVAATWSMRASAARTAATWLPADALVAAAARRSSRRWRSIAPACGRARRGFLRPVAAAGRSGGAAGRGGPRRRTRRQPARRTARRADDPRADTPGSGWSRWASSRPARRPSPASRSSTPTAGSSSSPRSGGRRTRSGRPHWAAAMRWRREMPCRS